MEDGAFNCLLSDPCAAGQHDCERAEYCVNPEKGVYYCQCPVGFIGNGRQCAPDPDLDGVPNTQLDVGCDSPPCPVVSNLCEPTVQHLYFLGLSSQIADIIILQTFALLFALSVCLKFAREISTIQYFKIRTGRLCNWTKYCT